MSYLSTKIFRKMTAGVLAFTIIFTAITFVRPVKAIAAGMMYYVSTATGSDTNDGSLAAPFKTIQKAVDAASGGDTVFVRAGTYNEEVKVGTDGITIQNYNGEKVNLSGCTRITGWTPTTVNGSISAWKAPMDWDMYNGTGNMIFCDGVLMNEATTPNKPPQTFNLGNMGRSPRVTSTPDSDGMHHLYVLPCTDSSLPSGQIWPADLTSLVGGYWWDSTPARWMSYNGEIIAADNVARTITVRWLMPSTNGYYGIGNGTSYFFVSRGMGNLTAPGEWYKDVANKEIYFIAPGNGDPNTMFVEAKQRKYCIDISNRKNILIKGIDMKAGEINFAGTEYCVLDGSVLETSDFNMPVQWETGGSAANGLLLEGIHNTIRNCELKNMNGPGIDIQGHDNIVVNNYIHDYDFFEYYADGVAIHGYNQLVTRNTIKDGGRGCIGGGYRNSVVSYNDIGPGMRIASDGGAYYVGGTDFENSEFHHNILHDAQGSIYYDNFSYNAITYNNITYATSYGIQGNQPCEFMLYYNNSINSGKSFNIYLSPNENGTGWGVKRINNLFTASSPYGTAPGTYDATNIRPFAATNYNEDYTLKAGSPGIDQGTLLSGINDGYVGNAPDIGAKEFGGTNWTAGCNLANPVIDNLVLTFNTAIPYKNLLSNAGFERSNFECWNIDAGSPSILTQGTWARNMTVYARHGGYSAILHEGDRISQTITGLKPNTRYLVSFWPKLSGPIIQAVSYVNSGGSGLVSKNTTAEGYLYGMKNGDWFEYDYNCGSKVYDKMEFLLSGKVRTAGNVINVYKDSLSGPLLGTYDLSTSTNANGYYNGFALSQALTGSGKIVVQFVGADNICSFSSFRLYSTVPDAGVKVGATNFGRPETSITVNTAGWTTSQYPNNFSFITGPNSTSATIYAEKPLNSGNNFSYVDAFGVVEDVNPTFPSGFTFKDGFETPLLPLWAKTAGVGTNSTAQVAEAAHSYIVDENKDVVSKEFTSSLNKVVTMKFYDDMDATKKAAGNVSTAADVSATSLMLGVDTGVSATNYSYMVGNTTFVSTPVVRSLGWHEFKWDFSEGSHVDMYIDNHLVYSTKSFRVFTVVSLGDFWTDTMTNTNTYFDDVQVRDWLNEDAPTLKIPSYINSNTNVVTWNFTASDMFDTMNGNPIPITYTVNGTPVSSGDSFPDGITKVDYTATNSHGVSTSGSFFVNVKGDMPWDQMPVYDNFDDKNWTNPAWSVYTKWPEIVAAPSNHPGLTTPLAENFVIQRTTGSTQGCWHYPVSALAGKVVSLWMYDTGGTNLKTLFRCGDGEKIYDVGMWAPNSESNYTLVTPGNVMVTMKPRSNGWHEYRFDFTKTGLVSVSIDGQTAQGAVDLPFDTAIELPNKPVFFFGDYNAGASGVLLDDLRIGTPGLASAISQDPTIFVHNETAPVDVPTALDAGITVSAGRPFKNVWATFDCGYIANQDVLVFDPAGVDVGDITASAFDAAAGRLQLTSEGAATEAQWQEALRALKYVNKVSDPFNSEPYLRVIDIQAYDGVNFNAYTPRYINTVKKPTTKAALTGNSSVNVGEEFMVSYGLNSVAQSVYGGVYAQDITIKYNQNAFDFVGAQSLNNNTVILDTYSSAPGIYRFILASTGEAITQDGQILGIEFKVKDNAAGAETIELLNAELANGEGTVIKAETSNITIEVKRADKTILNQVIAESQETLDSAVEGIEIGQYPRGTKERLQAAIVRAQAVANNESATQVDVNTAIAELSLVINKFDSLKITESTGDINNKDGINLGDLGIVARYYGEKEGSSNWEAAKVADIDGDGEIGIYDLAFIAKKIIGK